MAGQMDIFYLALQCLSVVESFVFWGLSLNGLHFNVAVCLDIYLN